MALKPGDIVTLPTGHKAIVINDPWVKGDAIWITTADDNGQLQLIERAKVTKVPYKGRPA